MSCKWTFSKRVKKTRKPEYQAVNRHRWRDVKHRSTASICIMDPIIPSTMIRWFTAFSCAKNSLVMSRILHVLLNKSTNPKMTEASQTNTSSDIIPPNMFTLTSTPKHRLFKELLGPWNKNNRNKFRALSLQSQAPGHGWYWAGNVGNCRTTSCRVSMGFHGKAPSFIDIKQDWKGVMMLTTNPCMNVTLHSHGKKKQTTSSKLYIYIYTYLYRQLFVGGDISHENQWESKQSNKKHMSAVKFSRWNLFKKKGVALTSLQPF